MSSFYVLIQLAGEKNPEPNMVWSSTTLDLGIFKSTKILHSLDNKSKNQSDNTIKNKLKIYFCRLVIILLFYKHATSGDKTVQKKNYQYLLNPLLNFFAEKKKKICINCPLMQNTLINSSFFLVYWFTGSVRQFTEATIM